MSKARLPFMDIYWKKKVYPALLKNNLIAKRGRLIAKKLFFSYTQKGVGQKDYSKKSKPSSWML